MKIRLAKKIMVHDVRGKTYEERHAILLKRNWYWTYRFAKYYEVRKFKGPAGILKCDHSITKAIRLTRKKI